MTAPPGPAWLAGHPTGRRRLRRLSRGWASVGVGVAPDRLEQIAAGHEPTAAELVDITFAELALRTKHELRHDQHVSSKRRLVRGVMVIAATIVALNALLCLGLTFFLLATHSSPF